MYNWKKWLLFIFFSYCFLPETKTTQQLLYPNFEEPETKQFCHMAIHNINEKIYIGGVNRIYQLSKDLNLEAVVDMGPEMDSPSCRGKGLCRNEKLYLTDYYNKALVIDYSSDKLIACGSLFQGTCTVHNINDILIYKTPTAEAIVANNATASTVAFIAPGPDTRFGYPDVLYVGVSNTEEGPYPSHVPAISSRSLNPSSMFKVAYTSFTRGTYMLFNGIFRVRYPITYVYGFSHGGVSYFLTVQKLYDSKSYISKIARVCQRDRAYNSYAEIKLECSSGSLNYNILQAAFVGNPGNAIARSLGISTNESVLFAAFAKSKDDGNEPSMNSAICFYTLSHIRRLFNEELVQRCFYGRTMLLMDHVFSHLLCNPAHLLLTDSFCAMDKIDGKIPVKSGFLGPIMQFSGTLITAVAVTSSRNYTVLFLGTSNGHLKKVVVEDATKAWEYKDETIDEGSPVNSDMHFDKERNHLYVMTKKKVTPEICKLIQNLNNFCFHSKYLI